MRLLSIFLFACYGLFFAACQPAEEESSRQQAISITNEADIALKDKGIAIERNELQVEENKIPLLKDAQGVLIPAQVDDTDGDGDWDVLFLVTDFAANETKTLNISWAEEATDFTIRTSVRFGKRAAADQPVAAKTSDTLSADGLPKSIGYQPYQTDGPSWENDKVGFRHYFDGRNAKDLFGKKTAAMSPEDVGVNAEGAVVDDYHVMEDWGRDILAVGNAVGLGGVALLIDGTPARLGVTVDDAINNVENTVFKILSEGPVRSMMSFQYLNWETNGRIYPMLEEKVSIVPGMYAYKNEVKLQGLQGDEQLAIGLVNIHHDGELREINEFEDWVVLMTHDQQTYDKEWYLGMALLLPKAAYQSFTEAPDTGKLTDTYLAQLAIEEDRPVSYYAVAGWELSDEGFRDAAYFEAHVRELVAQLEARLSIDIVEKKD